MHKKVRFAAEAAFFLYTTTNYLTEIKQHSLSPGLQNSAASQEILGTE
jgi:hypothetical protein